MSLAWDEALLDSAAAGNANPTVRFWTWRSCAVVLGRFQSPANEIDDDELRAWGGQALRRLTGGGAMIAEPGAVITYSLVFPAAWVAGATVQDSYALADSWAVAALRQLGVDCWHAPVNDIACAAGKIAGAAQARRAGWILHHTMLAYRFDNDLMRRLLRHGRRRPHRGIRSAEKTVSPLADHLPRHSREEIVAALIAGFRATATVVEGEPLPEEMKAAELLAQTRYGAPAWLAETP